jgi:hypothetical protein
MKQHFACLTAVAACAMLAMPHLTEAQTPDAISPSIGTPDKVETRIGTLEFKDGAPSPETVAKIYDNLAFTHAFNAGVKRGNWIQTDPTKGWFTVFRLYSPLEPFFTKEWRPSEITLVR